MSSAPDSVQYVIDLRTQLSHLYDHGFRFSTTKSFSIYFTRSRIACPPSLLLYDAPVEYRTSGKFLGLILDSRLTWRPHITSLKDTALRRLRLLQTLSPLFNLM